MSEPELSKSKWSQSHANAWHQTQLWLCGANFLPSSAINQLEMFQPADYDEHRGTLIRELDWVRDLGMNTLRIFLHEFLWLEDRDGFYGRLNDFLDLCAERGIRPMLVFFDACHQPEPRPGKQPAPRPGVHNSGWAQSPPVTVLLEKIRWRDLELYVKDVLARYHRDERVLCWDLYNEPCNAGFDGNEAKAEASAHLVEQVFGWARAVAPQQPLIVCLWSDPDPLKEHDLNSLKPHQRSLLKAQSFAMEHSDVISFHNYGPSEDLEQRIAELKTLGRPILCTEYMARTRGSLFQTCLPVLRRHNVAAYNWGFVAGKSGTIFPWGSPEGAPEPNPWFHDILRPDGRPFDPDEIHILRRMRACA